MFLLLWQLFLKMSCSWTFMISILKHVPLELPLTASRFHFCPPFAQPETHRASSPNYGVRYCNKNERWNYYTALWRGTFRLFKQLFFCSSSAAEMPIAFALVAFNVVVRGSENGRIGWWRWKMASFCGAGFDSAFASYVAPVIAPHADGRSNPTTFCFGMPGYAISLPSKWYYKIIFL